MLSKSMLLANTSVGKDMLVHENVGALSKLVFSAVALKQPAGYVVVLDINGMHSANHRYGMTAVDNKLLSCHIKASDVVIRLSGDEYCIPTASLLEAEKIVLRLSALYADQGLSAYFEIEEYADDLQKAVNTALDHIMQRKLLRDSSFFARLRRAWGIIINDGTR